MSERPPILVPVRVLAGESIPDGVPELLADAHVVLLGYHVIPDQTAPGQAQMQFGDRAATRMDDYQTAFEAAGATVERRLVFTHNAQKTIDRTIYEHGCLAVLVPAAVGTPEDVLIPVRGDVSADRLTHVVAGLFADTDVTVTLYHIAATEESEADATALLAGVRDRLLDRSMAPDRVVTRIERDREPFPAIVEDSADYDVVVMGETDPSLVTFVFGLPADQVAEQFLGPVFIVQRERPTTDA